jgi:hypothetical protein
LRPGRSTSCGQTAVTRCDSRTTLLTIQSHLGVTRMADAETTMVELKELVRDFRERRD